MRKLILFFTLCVICAVVFTYISIPKNAPLPSKPNPTGGNTVYTTTTTSTYIIYTTADWTTSGAMTGSILNGTHTTTVTSRITTWFTPPSPP
jgi:hypothetical protein